MNAKLVLERYQALLAYISQRAGDPDESAFGSLVSIAERADRDKRWLRRQKCLRKTKP
ncbi:MAG: hypothetical protein ABMA26_26925 [Limisphaerales bacterium]